MERIRPAAEGFGGRPMEEKNDERERREEREVERNCGLRESASEELMPSFRSR